MAQLRECQELQPLRALLPGTLRSIRSLFNFQSISYFEGCFQKASSQLLLSKHRQEDALSTHRNSHSRGGGSVQAAVADQSSGHLPALKALQLMGIKQEGCLPICPSHGVQTRTYGQLAGPVMLAPPCF